MSRYHCAHLAVALFVEAAGKKRVTDLAAKHGLPEGEIRAMAEFDPTKTDKFLGWIAAQVSNGEVSLPADGPELRAVLEDFLRKGRLLEKRDINSYWYRLLKVRLSETESKGEAYRAKVEGGQEVIHDEPPWKVVRITTPAAADKLCRPEWCIKDRKYWDEYDLGPGAPAYLVLRGGRKYACMVPHRSELKGTDDEPLEPTEEFGELLRKLAAQLKIIWDEDFVPFLHMMPDEEIAADPEMAFMYAEHVVKGRWPKGEATLARDPHWATLYAIHVIKKRFPKGEPAIARDPSFAFMYASSVVGGRFPEGEAAIADSKWACEYAKSVVKGRWPEGEAAIASRAVPYEVREYGKLIGDPDWLGKRAASARRRPAPTSRYHRARRAISRMATFRVLAWWSREMLGHKIQRLDLNPDDSRRFRALCDAFLASTDWDYLHDMCYWAASFLGVACREMGIPLRVATGRYSPEGDGFDHAWLEDASGTPFDIAAVAHAAHRSETRSGDMVGVAEVCPACDKAEELCDCEGGPEPVERTRRFSDEDEMMDAGYECAERDAFPEWKPEFVEPGRYDAGDVGDVAEGMAYQLGFDEEQKEAARDMAQKVTLALDVRAVAGRKRGAGAFASRGVYHRASAALGSGKPARDAAYAETLALIEAARRRYGDRLFGGNCGQFALGLARFLKDTGMHPDPRIGLISDDEAEEEGDLQGYGDVDIYHVFLQLGQAFYDGSGEIDRRYLEDLAAEDGDDDPALWTEFAPDEGARRIISFNTNWRIEWDDFYRFFEEARAGEGRRGAAVAASLGRALGPFGSGPDELPASVLRSGISSIGTGGTIEPWQMAGDSPEYAAMSVDELDRAAFGFSREDIESLHPSQLHIKWQDDWENAVYEQRRSGLSDKEWARMVDLSEPIEVVFENGRFYVDDGHHRFHAAKILDKELAVTVEIKDKPHRAIVEKALREGKPVPPEVLRGYPDLAANASPQINRGTGSLSGS